MSDTISPEQLAFLIELNASTIQLLSDFNAETRESHRQLVGHDTFEKLCRDQLFALSMVKDSSPIVRAAALWSIRNNWPLTEQEFLLIGNLATCDSDANVRFAAALALNEFDRVRFPSVTKILSQLVLDVDAGDHVRSAAYTSLRILTWSEIIVSTSKLAFPQGVDWESVGAMARGVPWDEIVDLAREHLIRIGALN